jgi:hypothetical protein
MQAVFLRRPCDRQRSQQARRIRHLVSQGTSARCRQILWRRKAWRYWSLTDPAVHQATYQFDDEAALDHAMKGEDMKRLIADFNRDWPDVTRTRDTFVLAEEFGA